MYVYVFENKLFLNQFKKVILSFPIPQWMVIGMRGEGWTMIEIKDWH